jgi:hypothetical protein
MMFETVTKMDIQDMIESNIELKYLMITFLISLKHTYSGTPS